VTAALPFLSTEKRKADTSRCPRKRGESATATLSVDRGRKVVLSLYILHGSGRRKSKISREENVPFVSTRKEKRGDDGGLCAEVGERGGPMSQAGRLHLVSSAAEEGRKGE